MGVGGVKFVSQYVWEILPSEILDYVLDLYKSMSFFSKARKLAESTPTYVILPRQQGVAMSRWRYPEYPSQVATPSGLMADPQAPPWLKRQG